MNIVDLIIILLLISALVRGREIGFVQQLCSTLGFFSGLIIGALLEPHTVALVHSAVSRSIVTLITTLGSALILLSVGEYVGILLKDKVHKWHADLPDNILGALLSLVSVLIAVWLSASILNSLPLPGLQSSVRSSKIVSGLTRKLPAAPNIIADLGHLIDPNGFPQVFINGEPNPPRNVTLPSIGELQPAVEKDKTSVVRIEGQGCGGVVEGSGFVVGGDLVATNAHVVAGISKPYVEDSNGVHTATPIWFDPDLDFAVLRADNLAGKPLVLSSKSVSRDTPAAVLGYPGGGNLKADAAAVIDEFTATGRNIYNQGATERDVYEVQADIIPGNSGGPLIAKDASVIGVVFAESTTYNHVGYALTMDQVIQEIHQAEAQDHTVSTGRCAD